LVVPELLPVLPLDEPPIPVEPEPRLPEPELLPVLGLVVLPELEPVAGLVVLPELEPVLPDPDVLPYCLTQSSRCVPVRPTHWLGVAVGLDVLLDPLAPLPLVPEELESDELEPVPDDEDPELDGLDDEPAPDPVDPLPALPPALGLLVELPLVPLPALPPELCAHEAVAMPSMAAATAAVSVFAITMYAPLVGLKDCSRKLASRMPRAEKTRPGT
jgi:hypothetical protein